MASGPKTAFGFALGRAIRPYLVFSWAVGSEADTGKTLRVQVTLTLGVSIFAGSKWEVSPRFAVPRCHFCHLIVLSFSSYSVWALLPTCARRECAGGLGPLFTWDGVATLHRSLGKVARSLAKGSGKGTEVILSEVHSLARFKNKSGKSSRRCVKSILGFPAFSVSQL